MSALILSHKHYKLMNLSLDHTKLVIKSTTPQFLNRNAMFSLSVVLKYQIILNHLIRHAMFYIYVVHP